MNWQEVRTIEDFFEWLPSYLAHRDTLQCEEDDYGNLTYTLSNGAGEVVLKYSSELHKIIRYD